MIRKTRILAAVIFAAAMFGSASAQRPAAKPDKPATGSTTKEDDIRRLLEVTGAAKIGEQILQRTSLLMRQSMPQVKEQDWQELQNELHNEFTSGNFVEMIVKIYSAHFTQAEIQALIKFYESPIGKKVVGAMPQITQESMEAGEERGREIVNKVLEKLKKKGYSVPTA
jgi:uncharacterized protein